MIDFEDALRIVLENTKPLGSERIFISEALNRVLYKNVYALSDRPSFDNAAMDGYAVINEDLSPLKKNLTVKLKISNSLPAGADNLEIKRGEAIKIYTGAPIPKGADTVVEIELCKEVDNDVEILAYKNIGANIRKQGEEIKKGDLLLTQGKVLRAYDIGILASENIASIEVYKTPKVGLFVTGDEILDICEPQVKLSQIRSSNHVSIMFLLETFGIKPSFLGFIKDDKEEIKTVLSRIDEFDVLISTGGVSVSDRDFVKDVVKELGFDVKFYKVAIKPGKPMLFAVKNDKLFFGLPGNAVSCITNFDIFTRTAIKKMMGYKDFMKPFLKAKLTSTIKRKSSDRMEFLRGVVNLEQDILCEAIPKTGSHMLTSFAEANCYIVIPKGVSEVKAGEMVDVLMFSSYIK